MENEIKQGQPVSSPVETGIADAGYDHVTKLIIMGCIAGVADEVYVARVEAAASEIMANLARRRKPSKHWCVASFKIIAPRE